MTFAKEVDAQVIAEGVENERELETLARLQHPVAAGLPPRAAG